MHLEQSGARANYSANLVNGKVDTITRATLADRGRGYDVDPTILYQHHQFKISMQELLLIFQMIELL